MIEGYPFDSLDFFVSDPLVFNGVAASEDSFPAFDMTRIPFSSTSNSLPSAPFIFLLAIFLPRYAMIGVDPSSDCGIRIVDVLLNTLEFMSTELSLLPGPSVLVLVLL